MNKFKKIVLKLLIAMPALFFAFKSNDVLAINNKELLQQKIKSNFNTKSIINKGDVHLDINSDPYKQPDGSYLFKGPTEEGVDYNHYNYIGGTSKNDIVHLNGYLGVGKINLFGGHNTLTISNSHIDLVNGSGLDIYNVHILNIKDNSVIERLNAYYGDHDITLNFGDLSVNEIIGIGIGKLNLYSNNKDSNIVINLNNTELYLANGGIEVLNSNATLNLGEKSKIYTHKAISLQGSRNAINMEKNSYIQGNIIFGNGNSSIQMKDSARIEGDILFGNGNSKMTIGHEAVAIGNIVFGSGNNTFTMLSNSTVEGNLTFKDGNNIIQTFLDGVNSNSPATIKGNAIFNNGNNKVHVISNSRLSIEGSLTSEGGSTNITVDRGGRLTVGKNIHLGGQNNNVTLHSASVTNASIEFDKSSSNNNVVIDTNTNTGSGGQVHLTGNINGSGNNDSITILGDGIFIINNTEEKGLHGFNNINLGLGSVEITNKFKQEEDLNVTIGLNDLDGKESQPRIHLDGDADFNNKNINIIYDGATKNVDEVGDEYTINLMQVDKGLTDPASIKLGKLIFTSAIYKIKENIHDNQMDVTLSKCSTFKDALSGKDLCQTGDTSVAESNILKVADYFDRLIEDGNLSEEYYKLLDKLGMMSLASLNSTLEASIMPIMGVTLFNINRNSINNFNNLTLNNKLQKIGNKDIAIWYNYNHSNIALDNIKGAKGANSVGNLLSTGIEYEFSNYMKVGVNAGYAKLNITGNDHLYKGHSNNLYYGIYGINKIVNNLVLNTNLTFLNASYTLNRDFVDTNVVSKPKVFQSNIDFLLSYKLNINESIAFAPFASFGYSYGIMDKYKEKGLMPYNVDKANFQEFSGGLGIKGSLTKKLEAYSIVPHITLAVNATSQKVDDTTVHYDSGVEFVSPDLKFHSDDYGAISGVGSIGISYILPNKTSLDFNVGTNMSNKIKSYNLGVALNITL